MAKRPTDLHWHPRAGEIHRAWKATGLPLTEVLFRYRTRATEEGFKTVKDLAAVKGWCYGWRLPQIHEYEVLAGVLNDALSPDSEARLDLTIGEPLLTDLAAA